MVETHPIPLYVTRDVPLVKDWETHPIPLHVTRDIPLVKDWVIIVLWATPFPHSTNGASVLVARICALNVPQLCEASGKRRVRIWNTVSFVGASPFLIVD